MTIQKLKEKIDELESLIDDAINKIDNLPSYEMGGDHGLGTEMELSKEGDWISVSDCYKVSRFLKQSKRGICDAFRD